MNHLLAQQEFERKVTTAVRASLIESGITAPNDAWLIDSDVIQFVEALRAEGYAIEPLPVPATPVEAAPAPRSHAKAEAPAIPAVPGQVTW